MPKFLNRNPHMIYVDLPSSAELTRIRPFAEYEASGEDADVLEATPGVVNLATASDQVQEEVKTTLSQRELLAGSSYPDPGSPSATPTAEADVAGAETLADKNVTDLRKLAKDAGISGFSKLNKEQLVDALEKRQAAVDAGADPEQAAEAAQPLPEPPPKVGKGSGTADWAKFAKSIGLEFPDDAKRADLFKLVDAELAKRAKAAEKAASDGGTVTSDQVPSKGS